MLRMIDFVLSFVGIVLLSPLLLAIWTIGFLLIQKPIFKQTRLGRNKKPFVLYKFRTMRLETPSVATHLVDGSSIFPFGKVLRKTKLDELPQLFNVLRGDMSLVGPRPNLSNQKILIDAREALDIYSHRPGITGLAQLQNVDMSTPNRLAKLDRQMLDNISLKNYTKYIIMTVLGNGQGDGVKK